jgi:hypothetical protein
MVIRGIWIAGEVIVEITIGVAKGTGIAMGIDMKGMTSTTTNYTLDGYSLLTS